MRFLLLFFLGGCSAILAATGDADLTKLETGASRRDVERALGRPKEVETQTTGVRATYHVTIGDPRSPSRAGKHLGREAAILTADGKATGDAGALWFILALPVAAVYEIGATGVELVRLGRAKSHRIEVWYDAQGRVTSWSQPVRIHPHRVDREAAPPRDESLEREWARVRKSKLGY